MKFTDHFKTYVKGWENPDLQPEHILEKISFVFTMESFKGLYFKLKEPLHDDYGIGMDCFKFAFNTDGVYINDGDMRFNDFMGQEISDSGADVVNFIKRYLIDNHLSNLIVS